MRGLWYPPMGKAFRGKVNKGPVVNPTVSNRMLEVDLNATHFRFVSWALNGQHHQGNIIHKKLTAGQAEIA